MFDRWIVILDGEVPEFFGPYSPLESAERAAERWNEKYPGDPGGARVAPLRGARELPYATDGGPSR